MNVETRETMELVFGMIEEGINLRQGGRRWSVTKMHHGIYRAIQFWGYTPGELLDLAPEIARAVDVQSSNTVSDSAYRFLKGQREGQGCFSPLERHTQPTAGTLEWEIDQEMLYDIWSPMMVDDELPSKNKHFLMILAEWMRLYDTQDLIDLASALLDAEARGLILAQGHLQRVAMSSGFGYKWHKVLPLIIDWARQEGLWEGKTKLKLIHDKKKKSTTKRARHHG